MARTRRCCCCQNIYQPEPSSGRVFLLQFHPDRGLPHRLTIERTLVLSPAVGQVRRIAVDYRRERLLYISVHFGSEPGDGLRFRDRSFDEPESTVLEHTISQPVITRVATKSATQRVFYVTQARVTNANELRAINHDGSDDALVLAGEMVPSPFIVGVDFEVFESPCYCRLNDRLYFQHFRPASVAPGDLSENGAVSRLRSCRPDGSDLQTHEQLGPDNLTSQSHQFMHVHNGTAKLYLARLTNGQAGGEWTISRYDLDGSNREDVVVMGRTTRGAHQPLGLTVSNERGKVVVYYYDRGGLVPGQDIPAWFECDLDGSGRRELADNRDFREASGGFSLPAPLGFGIEAACGYERFGIATKA